MFWEEEMEEEGREGMKTKKMTISITIIIIILTNAALRTRTQDVSAKDRTGKGTKHDAVQWTAWRREQRMSGEEIAQRACFGACES